MGSKISISELVGRFYGYVYAEYLLQNDPYLEIRKSRKGFLKLYNKFYSEHEEYVDLLYDFLFFYYNLAVIGEVRWAKYIATSGKIYVPYYATEREESISHLGNKTLPNKDFLEHAVFMFKKIYWRNNSYGGVSWGNIAEHVLKGFNKENKSFQEKIVWVDTALSLEHNSGNALNKENYYWDCFDFIGEISPRRVMDYKFAGEYDEIYMYFSSMARRIIGFYNKSLYTTRKSTPSSKINKCLTTTIKNMMGDEQISLEMFPKIRIGKKEYLPKELVDILEGGK